MDILLDRSYEESTIDFDVAFERSSADEPPKYNPIGEPEGEVPVAERILVRQIGLIDGPGGPFGFVGPDKWRPYSLGALDEVLDGLRQGAYAPTENVELFNRPLDLNCGATTLFVLHLRPLGGDRTLRFARTSPGITLGRFANTEEYRNYFSLRHVVENGFGQAAPYADRDCRILYFTAKKTSERFAHPFNLHLEVAYPSDVEGANVMSLTIDPDIRFPGGSGQ